MSFSLPWRLTSTFTLYDNSTTNSPHKIEHFCMTCVVFVLVQKTRRAVRRPSSAPGRTCASLSVGSVMGTKTVLMGPTRASKLAVVRLTGLIAHCCPSSWTYLLFRRHPPFIPIQFYQLLVWPGAKVAQTALFHYTVFTFRTTELDLIIRWSFPIITKKFKSQSNLAQQRPSMFKNSTWYQVLPPNGKAFEKKKSQIE